MKQNSGLLVGMLLWVACSSAAGSEEPQYTVRTTSPFLDVTLSLRQPAIASLCQSGEFA